MNGDGIIPDELYKETLAAANPEELTRIQAQLLVESQLTEDPKMVPLMMGRKCVGLIHFDVQTGVISGKLMDPAFGPLLEELFGKKLLEVAFYGKPGMPYNEAKIKMDEFLKADVGTEI